MGKFIFRYDKILNIKKEMEDEIKNKLAIEIQKLNEFNDELENNIKKQKEYLSFINNSISNVIKASDLKRFNNSKEYYKREILSLRLKKKNQKVIILSKREELNKAMQETKKYEKMKENHFEVYIAKMYEKERKETEEIVNYKNYKLSGDRNGRKKQDQG
jgi:flagellar export protein FliJ